MTVPNGIEKSDCQLNSIQNINCFLLDVTRASDYLLYYTFCGSLILLRFFVPVRP